MIFALMDANVGGTPVLGELLRTWSVPVAPLIALVIMLVLYLRGWWFARGREPRGYATLTFCCPPACLLRLYRPLQAGRHQRRQSWL